MVVLVSACAGEVETKVVGDVEFQIRNAEYEAGKTIITLSTNASVDNARIDIIDEADKLLCTRYKDLIAGTTQIELSDCKAKDKITVSVSPPGGGIVTQEFTLGIPTPRVEVVSAEYKVGAQLALNLDANMEIKNTRVEVLDKGGNVLCTKYADLSEGLNELKPKGCGTEAKITISVTPPEGVMTTSDFSLDLPLLELKKGFRYVYSAANCPDCTRRDSSLYVTEETNSYWEGICGIKFDEEKKAYLIRWKLDKADLGLSLTNLLAKDKVLGDVVYGGISQMPQIGEAGGSIIPLWMPVLKGIYGLDIDELITKRTTIMDAEQGQTATFTAPDPDLYGNYLAYTLNIEVYKDGKQEDTGEIIIATAKPYLTIEIKVGGGPQTTFKRIEEKDFSLNDFAGYSIEALSP